MSRRILGIIALLVAFSLSPRQLVGSDADEAGQSTTTTVGAPALPAVEEGVSPSSYGRTPGLLVPYRGVGEPYRQMYQEAPAYRGPGRDEPDPDDLKSVRIGVLVPLEGGRAGQGKSVADGVRLAFEEANGRGGYSGLPFEAMVRDDLPTWGSSAGALVEMTYDDGLWALIGSTESNTTHIAARLALKINLPIVTVNSPDPTITEHAIPWIVRLSPDDRQTGYRLADLLFTRMGATRVAVIRSSNRYGRVGIKEFREASRRLGRPVPVEVQYVPGSKDFSAQVQRVAAVGADVVVMWADPDGGARIVRAIREQGLTMPIVATDRLVDPDFLAMAGDAAEGLIATHPLPVERAETGWRDFAQTYKERFETEADIYAAWGYDAGRAVVEAVLEAGLNRARIRDALHDPDQRSGVAGPVEQDITGNNPVRPVLVRVVGGRFVDMD